MMIRCREQSYFSAIAQIWSPRPFETVFERIDALTGAGEARCIGADQSHGQRSYVLMLISGGRNDPAGNSTSSTPARYSPDA